MSRSPYSTSRTLTWLLVAALLFPVLVCYTILYRYAVAIPLLDDYEDTLGFLLQQQQLHGFWPKLLACLTAQQAEYKFIFEHLVIAVQFSLIHHLSLGLDLLLGDLLLLPILFVLAAELFPGTTGRQRLLLLVPASFLACQLTYAEVLNWTLGSFNALAVVAFTLLAFHLLARPRPLSVALACICFPLACGSATNGFFAAPLGVALLYGSRHRTALAAWIGTAFATLLVFLFRYQRVAHPPGPDLGARALFLLSFLGGAVENMHRRPLPGAAVALGTLLLVTVVHAFLTGYARRNPVMLAIAAWALLTAPTVAWFRSSMGTAQSLSGRYKLYSMLLLVFAYGYLADIIRHAPALRPERKRQLYQLTLAASVLFFCAAIVTGTMFLRRRQDSLVLGLNHFLANPAQNSPIYLPPGETPLSPALNEETRRILEQSIARGIYTPPLPLRETTQR